MWGREVRECRFIKNDIPRDEGFVGRRVMTFVSFGVRRILKKNARCGAWGKFIRSLAREIGITQATEYTEISVVKLVMTYELIRGLVLVFEEARRLIRYMAVANVSTKNTEVTPEFKLSALIVLRIC